jgi:hypothetical protein
MVFGLDLCALCVFVVKIALRLAVTESKDGSISARQSGCLDPGRVWVDPFTSRVGRDRPASQEGIGLLGSPGLGLVHVLLHHHFLVVGISVGENR